MRHFVLTAGLLAIIACSDAVPEDVALGEVAQAYNAPVTLNSQFGTRTATNRNRCDRSSSGQVCTIPDFHDVLYCVSNVSPQFAGSTRSRIHTLMSAMDSLLTTRSIFQPLDVFGQCIETDADVVFVKSAVGSSGTGSNDIQNYSRADFTNTTGLTENGLPGEPAVVGQYQTHGRCNIRIDENDILAKGSNATQDQRYLDHAVLNAFVTCLGKGRIPGDSLINFNRAMQHPMSSTHANDAFTSGELCQLNSYNNSNNGNFANAGNCGND